MKNFSEIYLEKNKEYFLGFENNYNLKKKIIIKEKFGFINLNKLITNAPPP